MQYRMPMRERQQGVATLTETQIDELRRVFGARW
jgi:hypothetical protein